ncbi:glutamate ABC transporter substrate-binding protein [Kitasatospora sp. LaBMicrA B282]|uniref:glutamate ABC transporter substrate-binding protein n=1 Tax=Kitasatospora sp. LaBMicrA B282 TaxID=3420949 RepID=UPI003D0D0409
MRNTTGEWNRRALQRAVLPVTAVLLAGCAAASGSGAGTGTAVRAAASASPGNAPGSAASAVPVDATGCDPTRSIKPSSSDLGPKVSQIKQRGYLIAGVDQNAYRWGYRNAQGGQVEGFDIDIVHAIAKAILGDPNAVRYVDVPAATRIPEIQNHQVDLVVRAMAINCQRMTQVAFSTVYFQAGHQALVPVSSPARTLDEALRGKRVCVTKGATEQDEITQNDHGAAQVVWADNEVDCLVQLQLGKADAVFTDNAYGSALVAQDPQVRLVDKPYGTKYFGVAMNLADTDLVARVNQVLEDYRKGPWQASYATWLAPYLGAGATPPPAAYLP